MQGIGEILTNFVCANLWDRLFRLTLISATARKETMQQFMEQNKQVTNNVSVSLKLQEFDWILVT